MNEIQLAAMIYIERLKDGAPESLMEGNSLRVGREPSEPSGLFLAEDMGRDIWSAAVGVRSRFSRPV